MGRPRFQDRRLRLPGEHPLAFWLGLRNALLFTLPLYAVLAWVLWVTYGSH